jgi:uncharacterized protein YkuJ
MGVQLQQFVDRMVGIAEQKGLSASYPVILKIKEPDQETYIAVSYDEPHDGVQLLPLDAIWIDGDPASPDYKAVFKRSSKTPNGGLQNTWVEVTTYEEVFTPPQTWAPEDDPTQVFHEESDLYQTLLTKVSKEGDQLTGALLARVLQEGEQWSQAELIPRSHVTSQLNQQTNSFYNILLQIIQRLTNVETLANDNKRRLDEFDLNGGGNGVVSYIHDQTDAADTWVIEHNFGSENIMYRFEDDTGRELSPAQVFIVEDLQNPATRSAAIFAEPVAGKAILVRVTA